MRTWDRSQQTVQHAQGENTRFYAVDREESGYIVEFNV